MNEYNLADSEKRFVELIWANEPVSSGELVKLCEQEFGWKKPTTYTVLRRLSNKNIVKNQSSTVTSIIKKEDFHSIQSKQFVDKTFNGSLPKFIAAFSKGKKLTNKDITELQKLIDEYNETED